MFRSFFALASSRFALAVCAGVTSILFSIGSAALDIQVPLDPAGTYLREVPVGGDPSPVDAVPLDLVALGINPGDTIQLTRLGEFDNGSGQVLTGMVAVFSASATLLPPSNLNRVVDAIDAGTDFPTRPTHRTGEATDISEDFFVDDVMIVVPGGALFLFPNQPSMVSEVSRGRWWVESIS